MISNQLVELEISATVYIIAESLVAYFFLYEFSLADPSERTVIEYSESSLTVLWPSIITAKNGKKTLKALQLQFRSEIWIRKCSNKPVIKGGFNCSQEHFAR